MQSNRPEVSVRRAGSQNPAETYPSEFVSGNYFETFGIKPFAGRMFTSQDDNEGAAPTAVMSYRAWEQHFGSDPAIVGSAFMIDGKPFTIVGVAPPGFYGDRLREDPPDFYIPDIVRAGDQPEELDPEDRQSALALPYRADETGRCASRG